MTIMAFEKKWFYRRLKQKKIKEMGEGFIIFTIEVNRKYAIATEKYQ